MVKFSTGSLANPSSSSYTVTNFNGVDYNTTPTNVDDTRAIDISNYLPEGNCLVKRHGYKKLMQIKFTFANDYETERDKIVGVFRFGDGYVVAYSYLETNQQGSGTNKISIVYTSALNSSTYSVLRTIECGNIDPKVSGFIKGGRLFLLTGIEYLVVYKNDSNNVICNKVSNVAYIPTIAIGIMPNTVTAKSAVSYEQFNILTGKCKIKCYTNIDDYTRTDIGSGAKKLSYNCTYDLSAYFNGNITGISKINGASISSNKYRAQTSIGYFDISASISSNGVISVSMSSVSTYMESMLSTLTGIEEFEYELSTTTNTQKYVNQMTLFTFFGNDTSRDTLFIGGSTDEEIKNMDVHSVSPLENESNNEWLAYTYFGDMTYHSIGSSSAAIIGYGLNSNGTLSIIKETKDNEPNVYIRKCSVTVETKSIVVDTEVISWKEPNVVFSVLPSSTFINCGEYSGVTTFNGQTLIMSSDGIYSIDLTSTNADQTYTGVNVAHYVSDDFSKNGNISFAETDNKLYVSRYNKNNKLRIYVCDKNRYSYYNSKMVYEWWILDDIPADRLFVLDNKLYFSNENSLFLFDNDKFYDEYDIECNSVTVGESTYTSDMFYNPTTDLFELSTDSKIIKSCESKTDFINFREYTTIQIDEELIWEMPCLYDTSVNYQDKIVTLNLKSGVDTFNNYYNAFDIVSCVTDMCNNGIIKFIYDDLSFTPIPKNVTYSAHENYVSVVIKCTTSECEDIGGFECRVNKNVKFNICNLYTRKDNNLININDTIYDGNVFVYQSLDNNVVYQELSNAKFNIFTVKYLGIEMNLSRQTSGALPKIMVNVNKPIYSKWLSKFNSLGKLDYLKSVESLHFVCDARKGGNTRVGYRTQKKEVGYVTSYFSDTLDFNDLNFNQFAFATEMFARTYSSKKKIKNFAFIQLKFYSDVPEDSTIVSCTFKYKISKENKGVK